MDVAADLAMLIRNIASEISSGQASPGVIDGRVIGYDQALGTITVVIPKYHHPNGNPFTLEVPYGMFMAGDTYGDYFYPEVGLFCTLAVIEGATGETVQINFAHDAVNPPANLEGSADPSPNAPSIIAPLQPGERLILPKSGFGIRFSADDGIQMGGTTDGGQVPSAVEGSIVDPTALLSALENAASVAASDAVPGDGGKVAFLSFASTLRILIATSPAYLEPTDALCWIDDPAHDPTVGSGGAQSILLPGPGQR
jgi:hypothetical protein